jgi:hypothetical protein
MGQNPLSYYILYNESKHNNILKALGSQCQQTKVLKQITQKIFSVTVCNQQFSSLGESTTSSCWEQNNQAKYRM